MKYIFCRLGKVLTENEKDFYLKPGAKQDLRFSRFQTSIKQFYIILTFIYQVIIIKIPKKKYLGIAIRI